MSSYYANLTDPLDSILFFKRKAESKVLLLIYNTQRVLENRMAENTKTVKFFDISNLTR